jgi:hypothetical protein
METNIENQKQQMIKPAMSYGFFFSMFLIAFTVIIWVANLMENPYISIPKYLIIIVCLYFFAKKYRDEFNEGYTSYGRAMKFCALMLVFVSFISGIFTVIFYKFIDPGLINEIQEKTREVMLERNPDFTEDQINKGLYFQSIFIYIGSFIGIYLIGILISLITNIFVMKKDKSFDNSSFQPPL